MLLVRPPRVVDQSNIRRNVRVVRGVGHGLDEKAVEAVSKYRFKPSMEHGQPVPVENTDMGVGFRPTFPDAGKRPRYPPPMTSITLASTPSSTIRKPTVTGNEKPAVPRFRGLK